MVKTARYFVGISHKFKAKVFSSRLELGKITKSRFPRHRVIVGPFTSKRACGLEELWNKYNKAMPIGKSKRNPVPFDTDDNINNGPDFSDGRVEIYDRILQIDAIKGNGGEFPNQKFYHKFKKSSGAKIYGLPNGDILIQGNCNLWKMFNY